MRFRWKTIYLMLGLLVARVATGSVLVVYPAAAEPYRSVYRLLAQGIENAAGEPLEYRELTEGMKPLDLHGIFSTRDRANAIVLLGEPALKLYRQYREASFPKDPRPVFVGGIWQAPTRVPLPGVSLIVDPDLNLQRLRVLEPNIVNLVVFYDVRKDYWIEAAREAASKIGISVEAVGVMDPGTLQAELDAIFARVDPATTAVWVFVPLDQARSWDIAKRGWYRNVIFFSDDIEAVRAGFLFAFHPDYRKVGEELGDLIRKKAVGSTFQFTRAALFAFNRKTASHLMVQWPLNMEANFVFPAP